ncbi:MAG: hypothetical protein IT372_30240 [Polyangiaceae bacterium]|nr:hypothetical protein [Polyangiaceae bacterium]
MSTFAEPKDGKKPSFTYVRIGVPSYDELFEKTSEIYALVYQTSQMELRSLHRGGALLPGIAADLTSLGG